MFQPFDKDVFDKRFDDILAPAIETAGLEPYRVDRDLGAVVPIETLHSEILASAICLADITSRNANVMYELGFAIASSKDVVIICGPSASPSDKYPFDIQHRGIVPYATGSTSDFTKLGADVTAKLDALIARREKAAELVAVATPRMGQLMTAHEARALAILFAATDYRDEPISATWLKQQMANAGVNALGTRIAALRLERDGYIKAGWTAQDYDGSTPTYRVTDLAEEWLLDAKHQFNLEEPGKRNSPNHLQMDKAADDDDIPF